MTIAEQFKAEGRGEGLEEGILIDQIQLMQRSLAQTPDSQKTLGDMALESLRQLRDELEREFLKGR